MKEAYKMYQLDPVPLKLELQECIDRNAAEGWLLQHWEIAPMGEWCTVVFYKNVEN